MKVYYSDTYTFPIPEGHWFPVEKYKMLRKKLIEQKTLSEKDLIEADLATKEQITLAHTTEYFDAFEQGALDPQSVRRLGFPWSYRLFLRSIASVGGAVQSAREALQSGIAGNLAGGTHHAFMDHGEGFCVFNDFAVVSILLQKEKLAKKIAIIDLDVHQGNGNSAILGNNSSVFIFSMHGKNNYPFKKISSTLDIDLEDGVKDDEYLFHLKNNLPSIFEFKPDIILYQAGVDTLKEDRLGRLSLTKDGLVERDRLVFSECIKKDIPVSIGLGGGYSNPIDHTVDAYCGTYKVAKELFKC